MISVTKSSSGRAALAGEANIHNIEALKVGLSSLQIDPADGFQIDLEGLTDLDTAGVQVLLAFKRLFKGKKLVFVSCPLQPAAVIENCGLKAQLL